jgi:hypothetical protein
MQITWSELDHMVVPEKSARTRAPLLNLTEESFRDLLLSIGNQQTTREKFDSSYHDFIDNCFNQLHLQHISEADIDKFLAGKPELTDEDIVKKLPDWLHNLKKAFFPNTANELAPHRS